MKRKPFIFTVFVPENRLTTVHPSLLIRDTIDSRNICGNMWKGSFLLMISLSQTIVGGVFYFSYFFPFKAYFFKLEAGFSYRFRYIAIQFPLQGSVKRLHCVIMIFSKERKKIKKVTKMAKTLFVICKHEWMSIFIKPPAVPLFCFRYLYSPSQNTHNNVLYHTPPSPPSSFSLSAVFTVKRKAMFY